MVQNDDSPMVLKRGEKESVKNPLRDERCIMVPLKQRLIIKGT